MYGRFLSDLRTSRLSDDYLKKEITLCRAEAGRMILASDRRPTGFAGNPRGVYLCLSEPVFGYGRIGQFFALMEQTSCKPVLGTVLEWFRRLAPNKFGSQLDSRRARLLPG